MGNGDHGKDSGEAEVFHGVFISRTDQLHGLYYIYCGSALVKQRF